MDQSLNIPDSEYPRIVIIGAGFAGMKLATKLKSKDYQVVLVDKNNYHQFQPLYYQVAMAGLEPSSISFPLRKVFQDCKNVFIRCAELQSINTQKNCIYTSEGHLSYDKLVIATGVGTNFYGNKNIESSAFTLKTVSDAIQIRNEMLNDFEKAVLTNDFLERQGYIDTVIVGGGPTGVELAGALAEMKHYILPKDYKELDHEEVDIYLIQSGNCVLPGMSEKARNASLKYLEELGVTVLLNNRVTDYDGEFVHTNTGEKIRTRKLIWAAGVSGKQIKGLETAYGRGNRLLVNPQNEVDGLDSVYAIGDAALMLNESEYGHPQVAQVAIQQADNLANNLIKGKQKDFFYKDLGSMATIGRNKAVCDFPRFSMKGFFAWVIWLLVHLMAILGVKNKLFVIINWFWNYATYDQSLRLIIKPKQPIGTEKPH